MQRFLPDLVFSSFKKHALFAGIILQDDLPQSQGGAARTVGFGLVVRFLDCNIVLFSLVKLFGGQADELEEHVHSNGKVRRKEEADFIFPHDLLDFLHTVVPSGRAQDDILAACCRGPDVLLGRLRRRKIDTHVDALQ